MKFNASIIIRVFSKVMEGIALLSAFIFVNFYSVLGNTQFPDVRNYAGRDWGYAITILAVALIFIVLIKVNRIGNRFMNMWASNRALLLFLLIALLSISWTVFIQATLFKLVFLLFASLAASYIAVRFDLTGSIQIVTSAAALSIVLSYLIILFIPNGIMQNYPYIGSWRGMFWHRNHSGDIMAFFNGLFLFRLLFLSRQSIKIRVFEILFYGLSLVFVVKSRSATGVVVFLALHFFIALCFTWRKLHSKLKPWHYYTFAGIMVLGVLVFFSNVGFFFGLLGRSANMTGRIPLWQDLLFNIWPQKPILGYGYGALWMQRDFRYLMMDRQGWELFPVFFGDNGFIDVLLNLGLLGFIPFMVMFIARWYQSLKLVVATREGAHFFLPLTFTYVFVGNLSYSFLLEVDQFVWSLLIIAVFLTTQLRSRR